ncbi:MAG: hypothetical protein ABIQ43_03815 [Sphingomonas sp.]
MLAIAALFLSISDLTATFVGDLRGCGIDEKRALVEYRDDLQDRETGVAGSEPVSDEQIGCLAIAAATRGYHIEFADPSLNRRFAAVYEPKMREAGRIVARQELAKRGLLETAPQFEAGQPLAVFANRVEEFCGAKSGGLLKSRGTTLTIDPRTLRKLPYKRASDQIECVLLTLSAADLEPNDVSFGFIGNEFYAPPQRTTGKRR